MTRYRTKIHARIPEPNDNVTMTIGNKTIVDAVFSDTGLDAFLDGLKRVQFQRELGIDLIEGNLEFAEESISPQKRNERWAIRFIDEQYLDGNGELVRLMILAE